MKYQIMEVMMAPKFAGYYMYDGKDIDVGDMKYMAEANALIVRFEKLLRDGKVEEPIKIDKWSSVRIKWLDHEGLVLVSDYSTYEPAEKDISFSSAILSGQTLVDVETNEVIRSLNDIYKVGIGERRLGCSTSPETYQNKSTIYAYYLAERGSQSASDGQEINPLAAFCGEALL